MGQRRLEDRWEIILPPGRIRETAEPFKNERGEVVPVGELGKYFELMDAGDWDPVGIRPISGARCVAPPRPAEPWPRQTTLKTEIEQANAVYEMCRA